MGSSAKLAGRHPFSNAFRLQNRMATTLLLMVFDAPVLSFLIYLLNSTFRFLHAVSVPTFAVNQSPQPVPAAVSCP